jgi:hypothetical protein
MLALRGSDVQGAPAAGLARMLLPGVLSARELSFRIALDLAAELAPAALPRIPAPAYTLSWLVAAVEQIQKSPTRTPAALAQRAVRHAEQAGRETAIRVAGTDPRATGRWARMPHGDTCGFCLMLVSRGHVYASDRTGGFRAHDVCRCTAVPDYGDGPEAAEVSAAIARADDVYRRAARSEGDTLANLRRLARPGADAG